MVVLGGRELLVEPGDLLARPLGGPHRLLLR